MAPLALKIKGNKSFSPFANLDSEEDLSKTWRVCTKVKDSLENGSRLENLSWRLWFRHHLLTERSNAPFRKLSRTTARQLDHQNSNLTPLKDSNTSSKRVNRKDDKPEAEAPSCKVQETQQEALQQEKEPQPPPPAPMAVSIPHDHHQQQQPTQQPPAQQPPTQQPAQQQQPEPSWSAHASNPMAVDNNNNALLQSQQQQQLQGIQMASSAAIQIPELGGYDSTSNQQQQQQPQTFVLHQFTSDQASDQIVELDDIFGSLGNFQNFLPNNTAPDNGSGISALAQAIAHGNNPTPTSSGFSAQWTFDSFDSPVDIYFPSPVPPSLPQSHQQQQQQQQQSSQTPIQSTNATQQQQQQQPMMLDNASFAMQSQQQPQQPQQHLSFSVPTSPVMGTNRQHQQQQQQQSIPLAHGMLKQGTFGYMNGMGDNQPSSSMPPPSGTTRLMSMPGSVAGSPTHLYQPPQHPTNEYTPTMSTSASTASSSVASSTASPPTMANHPIVDHHPITTTTTTTTTTPCETNM